MQERQIVLSGEKVSLAEMCEKDQKQFFEWRRDHPELMNLVRDHGTPTLEGQKAWFRRSQEPDRHMFSIILRESEELIGHGGFVDIDAKEKTAQFRVTIGNPAYWGKGLGTEASSLILQYGFETLGLKSVWLRVPLDNERAQKSYRKLGFIEEGRETFEGEEFLKMTLCASMLRQAQHRLSSA